MLLAVFIFVPLVFFSRYYQELERRFLSKVKALQMLG